MHVLCGCGGVGSHWNTCCQHRYIDSRAQEKLEQCVSRVSELKGKEQLLTQKRGQLEQEIDKLQKQLANEKVCEERLCADVCVHVWVFMFGHGHLGHPYVEPHQMRERKLEDSMQLRKLEKEITDKDQAVRKIREDMKKNKLDQYSRQEQSSSHHLSHHLSHHNFF